MGGVRCDVARIDEKHCTFDRCEKYFNITKHSMAALAAIFGCVWGNFVGEFSILSVFGIYILCVIGYNVLWKHNILCKMKEVL